MNAKEVIDRLDHLKSVRHPHEYLWQEIGALASAKYLDNVDSGDSRGFIPHAEIYDTTLRVKGRMQANGITSMLFPRDRDWLRILPPWEMRNNKAAIKMYREAGEAVLHYLRQSNFHHINHSCIRSRSFDGTGSMLMEWIGNDDGTEGFNFRTNRTMHYWIDQDSKSRVNIFAMQYEWTAEKAAGEWGINNLSSKLQAEVRDPKMGNKKHKFILMIKRREAWERDGRSGTDAMPFSLTVVEEREKHIVINSGMETFGVVASRYEVHDSPWGYSPAWEILPDAYKANYAAKFMMVMGERAAVPPVVAPASMKEEGVGLGAAEVTYVSDLDPNTWPRELSSASNYTVGMDLLRNLRESIDEAYHGHLFNMFTRSEREMTATEATMRRGELNAQVSPTITALNQDHTDPVVTYAFNELAKRRVFELPGEAYREDGSIKVPQFAYDNSISMNHKAQQAVEAMTLVQNMINLQGAGADVDVVKLEETARRIWRDSGQDEDELMTEQEYQQQEEGKQQAIMEQQQAAQMQAAAGAAKDVGQSGIMQQLG